MIMFVCSDRLFFMRTREDGKRRFIDSDDSIMHARVGGWRKKRMSGFISSIHRLTNALLGMVLRREHGR